MCQTDAVLTPISPRHGLSQRQCALALMYNLVGPATVQRAVHIGRAVCESKRMQFFLSQVPFRAVYLTVTCCQLIPKAVRRADDPLLRLADLEF